MQKLKDIHYGTVEKCCCCIEPHTGAKIIGWLCILEVLGYVLMAISAVFTVGIGGIFILVGAIPSAYIAQAFWKCRQDESHEHKELYAHRFNLITKIAYGFLVLFAVISVFGGIFTGQFISVIFGLVYCFISFFILAHYNKTVRTYAQGHDGFKAQ